MSASFPASPLTLQVRSGGIGFVLHCRPAAVIFTYLTMAALVLLSSLTLDGLGIPYSSSAGSALVKIHPASYLSLIALVFWIGADGGPTKFADRVWVESPGVLAFVAAIALVLYQSVVVQKSPISSVADNFILAVALFVALQRLHPHEIARLGLVFQGFMLINSLLGYLEVVGHFHFVPMYEKGQLADYDWRGRAILGHPLVNSMVTALYIMTLALGGGRLRPIPRVLLIAFHLGAMACFGGRTSTLLALCVLAPVGGTHLAALLAGRKFRIETAAFAIAALAGLAILLPLALEAGVLDKFLSRFIDDSGSAGTRVAMLSVFRDMSLSEVMIAPNPTTIYATQVKLDLTIAIESAVVGCIARYGGIVTICLLLGLGAYLAEFVRRYGAKVLLPLGAYAVIAASATSFASKSTEIALLTLILFLQFEVVRPRRNSTPDAYSIAPHRPTHQDAGASAR